MKIRSLCYWLPKDRSRLFTQTKREKGKSRRDGEENVGKTEIRANKQKEEEERGGWEESGRLKRETKDPGEAV